MNAEFRHSLPVNRYMFYKYRVAQRYLMSEEPLDRNEELKEEARDIADSNVEDARKKIKNANNLSRNHPTSAVEGSNVKK